MTDDPFTSYRTSYSTTMAPYNIDDEAPSSPRTAALYYWGGGGNNWEDNCEVNHAKSEHKSGVATLRDYTTEGGQLFHRRHRPVIKFHLQMDDDDDCNHWMLRRAASVQATSAATAATNSEERCYATTVDAEHNVINDGDFESIPIIDLDQPLEKYSKLIGDACRETGFFYIVNHGIEDCVMDDVMDASRRLFALDLDSKIAMNAGTNAKAKKGYRGYFEIGAEDLENKDGTRDLASEEQSGLKKLLTMKGDFKEGFDVGLEQNGINDDDNNAFFGDNIWPDEDKHDSVIGFRTALLRYEDELLKLADKLMVAFATSLNTGLPEDYFLTRTRNPMCTLRLLHYPPSSNMAVTNSGCGAHTDYGLFTILQQDDIGGLQVRNHAKKWIDAKPLHGSLIINVGDMLSHWTSGVYASTVHRVVSPSSSSGRHRYSIPFFFNPDGDAVVEPILSNESSDSGNKEAGNRRISASQILMARYEGTFKSDN